MVKILIGYASDYGTTKKMAQAAAEGVTSVKGCQALLKNVEDICSEDMTSSAGIMLGSPVHMGSMDWRVKKMIDTVCAELWMNDMMNGKVAAVFACGGGFGGSGGGAELAMLAMLSNFAELGMLLLPLPKKINYYQHGGLHWGPCGRSGDANMKNVGVSSAVIHLTKQHAIHLAKTALVLANSDIFQN